MVEFVNNAHQAHPTRGACSGNAEFNEFGAGPNLGAGTPATREDQRVLSSTKFGEASLLRRLSRHRDSPFMHTPGCKHIRIRQPGYLMGCARPPLHKAQRPRLRRTWSVVPGPSPQRYDRRPWLCHPTILSQRHYTCAAVHSEVIGNEQSSYPANGGRTHW